MLKWKMKGGEIVPEESYAFHYDMIKNAVDNWYVSRVHWHIGALAAHTGATR